MRLHSARKPEHIRGTPQYRIGFARGTLVCSFSRELKMDTPSSAVFSDAKPLAGTGRGSNRTWVNVSACCWDATAAYVGDKPHMPFAASCRHWPHVETRRTQFVE
jgi:hypothetical protein